MPVRHRGISEPRASARAGRITSVLLAARLSFAACAGVPGVPPSYGFNFATITHAGNAPWVGRRNDFGDLISWGDVDYSYRIATTEVTNSQWLTFVRAAAPFVPANEAGDTSFTGLGTTRQGGQYILAEPGNWANRVGWRYGAWYCNWLMAGAPPAGVATAADFATGAYDISSFNYTGQIGITDQARRSEGALYWIPSIDEWVKAVYWDPNRFGADQPGYWLHPGGQETPLIAGPLPTGQTNRGATPGTYAIGQYPGTNLPWGLLDASGNATEWFEDKQGIGRWMTISELAPRPDGANVDRLNWKYGDDIYHVNGFRIASLVPAPSSLAPWLCFSLTLSRRKRSCRESQSPSSRSH